MRLDVNPTEQCVEGTDATSDPHPRRMNDPTMRQPAEDNGYQSNRDTVRTIQRQDQVI